jgi:hypothetical protein
VPLSGSAPIRDGRSPAVRFASAWARTGARRVRARWCRDTGDILIVRIQLGHRRQRIGQRLDTRQDPCPVVFQSGAVEGVAHRARRHRNIGRRAASGADNGLDRHSCIGDRAGGPPAGHGRSRSRRSAPRRGGSASRGWAEASALAGYRRQSSGSQRPRGHLLTRGNRRAVFPPHPGQPVRRFRHRLGPCAPDPRKRRRGGDRLDLVSRLFHPVGDRRHAAGHRWAARARPRRDCPGPPGRQDVVRGMAARPSADATLLSGTGNYKCGFRVCQGLGFDATCNLFRPTRFNRSRQSRSTRLPHSHELERSPINLAGIRRRRSSSSILAA